MSIAAPIIPGLTQFGEVLKTAFSKEDSRVNSAYTKPDSETGRVLARLRAAKREELIEQFAPQKFAGNKYLRYLGLGARVGSKLAGSPAEGLIYNSEKREIEKSSENPNASLPDYHKIEVLASLAQDHPLAKFINKQSPLFAEDFISILKSGFVDLHILRKADEDKVTTGVLAASLGPSHGDHVWTRDMAAVALGKLDMNAPEFASKIGIKLYKAYANPQQRNRINNLLRDPGVWSDESSDRDSIPHTRFDVEEVKDDAGAITD